ncbi:hypothetical protein C8Q80DRAFT_1272941 [Daedaleopsis nitida]|nr:hypothetical protein C8Q80DRAFT_1272941 [Daedaleopsis nitida]
MPLELPQELWGSVVRFLSREDRKSCLFVSRVHRDISLSYLFSTVTLCFGLWRKDEGDYYTPASMMDPPLHEEMQCRSTTTWELLRHISCTPSFAKYVKRLAIRAYSTSDGVFELRNLEEALGALHNLRSFHWYGWFFLPQPFILDALARSSGHRVTDIRLPYGAALTPSLSKLRNIRVLRLVPDSSALPDHYEGPRDLTNSIEENHYRILTHLSVYPGSVIWEFPVRAFFGLQELEIVAANNLGGLTLVFHHCSALRFLALCAIEVATISNQLVPLLIASATALPDLTALKIICDCGDLEFFSPHELTFAVSTFLANKQRLRMLDLVLHRDPEVPGLPMWATLPQLPNLEVLGIDLQSPQWSEGDIRRLDECIPLRLSALLVHATVLGRLFESLTERHSPEWISLIRKRTSLGYLHILDEQGAMDLKQQLLEDHPDSLQLVGYGPCLRWILRDSDLDPGDNAEDAPARPYYSAMWPFEKVAHRTAEDFGCAEWEWLLRHHDHASLDDLAPGML